MQQELGFLKNSFNTLDSNWKNMLWNNCADDLISIDKQLQQISLTNIIYPPKELVFNALKFTKFIDVRVVILGQDPYHGENEANGLAFSVNNNVRRPPSLNNIYAELLSEYLNYVKSSLTVQDLPNDLLFSWANQGVLLVNATLTVIKDKPNSLANIGWQRVTDRIIAMISQSLSNVVFVLWGNFAKSKVCLIDQSKHLILNAPHPSPLSAHRGFWGCNHFVLVNQYFMKLGKPKIKWLYTDSN